ncbi:chromosome condensation regulator RCC1 [soil metagenome]
MISRERASRSAIFIVAGALVLSLLSAVPAGAVVPNGLESPGSSQQNDNDLDGSSAADPASARLATQVIAVGETGFLAIIGGIVYGWGTITQAVEPHATWPGIDGTLTKVAGFPDNVTQLAAGPDHVCALDEKRTIYCAGFNDFGQLGRGTITADTSAEPIVDPHGVFTDKAIVQVAAGSGFTCALTNDGTIGCWGDNSRGELGGTSPTAPSPTGSAVPVEIVGSNPVFPSVFADFKAVQLAVTGGLICALKGTNYIADGTFVVPPHPVACWGANDAGQLGTDARGQAYSATPIDIVDPRANLSGATSIATSGETICVVTNRTVSDTGVAVSGVSCWGSGANGVAGQGTTDLVLTPTPVVTAPLDLSEIELTKLSVGGSNACASGGVTVICWGTNTDGGLGDNASSGTDEVFTAVAVVDVDNVLGGAEIVAIASAGGTTCAIADNGSLGCWGTGTQLQLGQEGSDASSAYPAAVLLDGKPLSGTVTIAGAKFSALASTFASPCGIAGGDAFCWARSVSSLGTGRSPASGTGCWFFGSAGNCEVAATPESSLPAKMSGELVGQTVVRVSPGPATSCAITDQARGYCWGSYPGDENWAAGGTYSATPVGLRGVLVDSVPANALQEIVVGDDPGACALTVEHRIACWGDETHSYHTHDPAQDFEATLRYPVWLSDLGALTDKNVVDIESGGQVTCALTDDNTVACWGRADLGGLGMGPIPNADAIGNPTPQRVLTDVLGGAAISQLAGGENGMCALAVTNQIACWGQGIAGGSDTPVLIDTTGLTAISSVTMTYNGICAIDSSLLYCWGEQFAGELGVGTDAGASPTASVAVPTLVNGGLLADRAIAQVVSGGSGTTCARTTDNLISCWGSNQAGALGIGSVDDGVISTFPQYSPVWPAGVARPRV